MLKHGADKLREHIEQPMDIWEFKLTCMGDETAGPEDSLKRAGEIADSIAQITDELKREVYIREMSKRIGIDIDAMRKAVNGRIKRRWYRKNGEDSADAKPDVKEYDKLLLASIISYPELARHFMEEAGPKMISSAVIKAIIEAIFHRAVEGLEISPAALMSDFTDSQFQEMIASVSMIPVTEETARKNIDDQLYQLKRAELREKRAEYSRKSATETDAEAKKALNEKMKEIEEKLKQLNKS